MRVVVTADDILRGCKLSPSSCPVALAIKRIFPGEDVVVSQRYIGVGYLNNYKHQWKWPTPKSVGDFISNFDFGDKVKPISFELEDK